MRVRGDGTKTDSVVEMEVLFFTPVQRLYKTLTWFGIFLGAGALTVFIPVIHFVAVPTFVFLALGALIFMPTVKKKIHKTHFICPYCQKPASLQRPSLSPPFRDSCPECRQLLSVEPEA